MSNRLLRRQQERRYSWAVQKTYKINKIIISGFYYYFMPYTFQLHNQRKERSRMQGSIYNLVPEVYLVNLKEKWMCHRLLLKIEIFTALGSAFGGLVATLEITTVAVDVDLDEFLQLANVLLS